jgi:hypothetical protein
LIQGIISIILASVTFFIVYCFKPIVQLTFSFKKRNLRWKDGQTYANEHMQRLLRSRAIGAVLALIVEFQEAQCFFILAISVAALVSPVVGDLSETTGAIFINDASTIQEGLVSAYIVRTLIIVGSIPVTLTQMCLHAANMRSWYLLSLTTMILILSLVLGTRVQLPSLDVIWEFFHKQNPVAACGGQISPSVYCLNRWAMLEIIEMPNSAILLVIADALLIVDMLVWKFKEHVQKRRVFQNQNLFRIATYLAHIIWLGFGIFCLVITITYSSVILNTYQVLSPTAASWTFGQVIALLVWAPVFAKYLILNIRKALDNFLLIFLFLAIVY